MSAIPLRSYLPRALCCAALLLISNAALGQIVRNEAQARAVAVAFAPVFYQGLGKEPRYDYITNFNFDGDWRGDNNWAHADDKRYALRAYIYYAVSETETHIFIHYAVFHPRDYKGGARGKFLSDIINESVARSGKFDPTGLAAEATVAHENDMEGCLVVVAKDGSELARARVVYVETLAHNRFLKFVPEGATEGTNKDDAAKTFTLDGQHPRLYIEPRGHGIEAYQANDKQRPRSLLRYNVGTRAVAPAANAETASYLLISLFDDPLWTRARKGVSEIYGATTDYGRLTLGLALANGRAQERQVEVGELGSAFLGKVGGHNMARPPWGWFDNKERDAPAGAWFFDPARTIKRHFKTGEDFSVEYTWQQFLSVGAAR